MTDGLLTLPDRKGGLPLVYVKALATRAEFPTSTLGPDRGSVGLRINTGGAPRPALNVQLKATAGFGKPRDGILPFRLPDVFVLFWCYENLDYIKGIPGGSTFAEIGKNVFRPVPVIVPTEPVLMLPSSAPSALRTIASSRTRGNSNRSLVLTTSSFPSSSRTNSAFTTSSALWRQ